jgi:hypothetical protein
VLIKGFVFAVDYEEFVIESATGGRLACRKQLPLKLAWYGFIE